MNLTEFNQSDRCERFSCPERSISPALYILLYVCSAAVVLLTVCGNMLVIISVFHFKKLHTPTNMLVLSLAVSDFLVGAFLMPLIFIWIIESCWMFGTDFCISFWLIAGITIIISIYNITLISVDRYLALSNPFLYSNMVSWKMMCIVVYSKWSMCLGYNILFYYFSGSFLSSVICPGECFLVLNEVWSVIDLVYAFIFPLCLIIILYTLVFVIVKKHATAIRELNNHTRHKAQKNTSLSVKSEMKAAKVLCILVSVFLMCLLPYFIYSSVSNIIGLQLEIIQKVLIILCLNSTINPVMYALFYPWFRRSFKLIITMQIFQTDSALISVIS